MGFWILGTLLAAAAPIAVAGYFIFARFRAPGGRTGRIEGVLLIDGKPAPPGTTVACSLSRGCKSAPAWLSFFTGAACDDVGQSFIMWSEYTMTENEGKFTFERLPEGEAHLGRAFGGSIRKSWLFGWVNTSLDSENQVDQDQTAIIRANETTYVTLGISSTNLRGRFVDSRDTKRIFDGLRAHCAFLSSKLEEPETPHEVPREEHEHRMYRVAVNGQGEFTASDVRPGRYKLRAALDHTPGDGGGPARPFGEYEGVVEVPAVDNDTAPATLDLGDLPLLIHTPLLPGDPLPTVQAHDHKGAPLEIPSCKDDYLLLCLWFPHDDIHGAVPKTLNALEKSRASRNNIPEVFVIAMDGQWAPAHYLLRGKKPVWPLKILSEEDSLPLATSFGVRNSAFFLFAPDGKLVEGEIAPKMLKVCLRRLSVTTV